MEKTERHGITRHPAACTFASLCVPPRACSLLLHRAALLRVISFVRACPRWSRLPHRQEPGHMRIHVAVRASTHASPPAAARGPAEGYFTRANPSAAVPVAHLPPSGAPRLVLSCLSAASPGRTFAPLSATGLGFGQAGTTPEIYFRLN